MTKEIKNIIIALMVMAAIVATPAQTFASEGSSPAEITSKCMVGSITHLQKGIYIVTNEIGIQRNAQYKGQEPLYIIGIEFLVRPTRRAPGILVYNLSPRSPNSPGGAEVIYGVRGPRLNPYCKNMGYVLP